MRSRNSLEHTLLISDNCRYLFILTVLMSAVPGGNLQDLCDVTIRSTSDGPKIGTFSSPNYPGNYNDDQICFYKIIGLSNEKVRINFTHFNVKGIPPRCHNDYIDIYTMVLNEGQLTNLLQVPVFGRFCGIFLEDLPHLLISMQNIIVIGLFSDDSKNETGFSGFYEFVSNEMYIMGTPEPPNVCGYTINSVHTPTGFIMAPTYPGVYPDDMFCYYKLNGFAGQRIRLEFVDFDLFDGGAHCPYDSVTIYDGYTNEAETIGIFCGKHTGLVIFSTHETLHIEFRTKGGRPEPEEKGYLTYWELAPNYEIQRRGFKAKYEFSDRFVNLDFISPAGYHITGTECDQHIRSAGESNGTIISPNYPYYYDLNTTCYYYLDGLMDDQNLEKVRVTFTSLSIPKFAGCTNGKVSLYLTGQDSSKSSPDRMYCGNVIPPQVTSSNPRLLVVFDSHGNIRGQGFEATYNFLTDFAIPGSPVTEDDCHFIYRSLRQKTGFFNSPRYPVYYPASIDCTFEFEALFNEQIRITFEAFKFFGNSSSCGDWLEIYNVVPSQQNRSLSTDIFFKRYCGDVIPGPLLSIPSANAMKILFHSDSNAAEKGFRATFEFKKMKDKVCGDRLNNGVGGVIRSPHYPMKYTLDIDCTWTIEASNVQHLIMIHFLSFKLEKSYGCQNAVLRVYTHGHEPTYELCGPREDLNKSKLLEITSEDSTMQLRFITTSGAQGKKGFKIAWTEVIKNKLDFCREFTCAKSKLCISKELLCNGIPNCGISDMSDENEHCSKEADFNMLHVILGTIVALLSLMIGSVCICHQRRKRTRKKSQHLPLEARIVATGSARESMDDKLDRLLIRDKMPKHTAV